MFRVAPKRKAAESLSRPARGSKKAAVSSDDASMGSTKPTIIIEDVQAKSSKPINVENENSNKNSNLTVDGEEKMETTVRKEGTPILISDESPKTKLDVTLEEVAIKEDEEEATTKKEELGEDVFEDEDEEVTEFDLCTHGDLVNDYMCYECTYNRFQFLYSHSNCCKPSTVTGGG